MKAEVVRLTVKVTKDVTYGDAPLQKLDFYEPDKPNGAAVLDIHGGGWFRGEKQKESDMAKRFAALGYHVAVPNYRLAPADFFPAARDDVLAAFSWLRTHAQVENLGVFGSSAGGSLAVDVGLAEGVPTVSWSGIFDIQQWFADHPAVVAQPDTKTDFVQTASAEIDQGGRNDPFYKWFILNYVDADETKFSRVEPFDRLTADAGPLYLANSQAEIIPVSGIYRLAQAAAKVGVPVTLQVIPGGQHAEGYLSAAWPGTVAFLAQHLVKGSI